MKFTPLILFICISIYSNTLYSQIDSSDNINQRLKVYISCEICDNTYLKENVQFVDYVRIPEEAEVYLLSTSLPTAAGGMDNTLFFIGQNGFRGMDDTIKVVTEVGETWEEKRKKSTQLIKVGLMRYISRTDLANYISINYQAPQKNNNNGSSQKDRWDLWYFRLSSNFNASGEKSYKNLGIWSSFSADRITEDWKTEFSISNNFSGSWYYVDDTTTIESKNLSYGFSNLIVKSISKHWSVGNSVYLNSSEFNNIKVSASFRPSIEYNIYPYSEASRRQLRFLYGIGPKQVYYNDTTIYLQIKELLFEHSLRMGFEQIEPWGSIYLSMSWANYLHDFKYNNLDFYTSINWRIFRGFSLRLSGGIDFIHNQLNLPKYSATPEEILTRQRILASQYSYWLSGGISYSFGSINNNIVNPRFDF